MIEFQNVSFSYDQKAVLTDFSLTVPDTGVIALFGPSGCGKTTVLRLLLGLEHPQSGEIVGRRESAAVVFQEDRLLPWETALHNAALPSGNTERAAELLRAVGLSNEDARKLPSELSGGMQRRVAIARALATDSRLLVLDEPFSGIDAANRDGIAALIREYAETKPVILVTHLPEEIDLLGAETIHMA